MASQKQLEADIANTANKPAFCYKAARAYAEMGDLDNAFKQFEIREKCLRKEKSFGKLGELFEEQFHLMEEHKHGTKAKRTGVVKKAINAYKKAGNYVHLDMAMSLANGKFPNLIDEMIDEKLNILMKRGNKFYFDQARDTAAQYERWDKLLDASLMHYTETRTADMKMKEDDVLDKDTQKNLENILNVFSKTGDWKGIVDKTNSVGFTDATLTVMEHVDLQALEQQPDDMSQFLTTYMETLKTKLSQVKNYFQNDPAMSFAVGEQLYDRIEQVVDKAVDFAEKKNVVYLSNRFGHLKKDFRKDRLNDYMELKMGLKTPEDKKKMADQLSGKDSGLLVVTAEEARRGGLDL